jgi:hypothetical protein
MLNIEQSNARAQTLAFITAMNMLLSKPQIPWHKDAPYKK